MRRLASSVATSRSAELYGRNQTIGIYLQGSAAKYDYFEQPNENVLNRDGDELAGTAGLRVTFAQNLVLDAGYRLNWRSFNSPKSHDTFGYFDGRLTWIPLGNVKFVLDVDRKFQEPISIFALASEQTTYSLQALYTPMPLLELGLFSHYREYDQIGVNEKFREELVAGTATYQLTAMVNLYAAIKYEQLEKESDGETTDDLRIGVGTKLKLQPGPRAAPTNGEYANFELPGGIVVTAAAGMSYIGFDRWNYSAKSDLLVDHVIAHNEDDGELDGIKFSGKVDGLVRRESGATIPAWPCMASMLDTTGRRPRAARGRPNRTVCSSHSLIPRPMSTTTRAGSSATGRPGSNMTPSTTVSVWKRSITNSGLAPAAVRAPPFQFRAGAELRAIDRDIDLDAVDNNFLCHRRSPSMRS